MKHNKRKKALAAVLSVILALVIVMSVWLIVVDSASRKAGLLELDTGSVPQQSEYETEEYDTDVNGITLHYAVTGEGYPVILLHGNGNSHSEFDGLVRYLANDFKVYAIDSRCQGKSTGDNISYKLMADDTACFIRTLNLSQPVIIGHSDGGIVGLYVAIYYPELLGGLISCGANSRPSGMKWYALLGTKISYAFSKSNLDKMMIEEPDITAGQLNDIKIPAYIVAGEFDIIRLSDTEFIADNISDSDLSIIKSADHTSYIDDGKKAYALINGWISKRLPEIQ
jgi:pimeloyl-ACP methyl ester carboxylesterase